MKKQLNLGELIDELKQIAQNQKHIVNKYGHEANVVFDFSSLYPIGFSSWRGAYNELAIEFAGQEYGDDRKNKVLTITEFVEALEDCIGKTFTGWKGGYFTMSRSNRLWVANSGTVGSTGVSGFRNNEYSIILETAEFEY